MSKYLGIIDYLDGISIVVIIITLSLLTASNANAVPQIFDGNAYEFVQVTNPFIGNNNHWSTASSSASASTHNGVNGHLATVTSQAENDFLLSLVTLYNGFNGAWLGGNATGWLEGPEAGNTFAQVGGYTNWNPVEPNNNGYMYMSIGTSTPNSGGIGHGNWLDDSGVQGLPHANADPVIGFFIEYENSAIFVSEPPIPALILLGLLGLWNRRRAHH
ncbi:hypothetical protein A9Q99_17275 [Gammaproteobacteria bacterium 45_16_T64]|nr:hypothetical protein A9Q99_17275 [Gammaproteobacteria bacterium 45_16_T64]